MDAGRTIKALREAKGMTKTELSQRANVSMAAIVYLEKGRTNVSFKVFDALIDALGYKVEIWPKD